MRALLGHGIEEGPFFPREPGWSRRSSAKGQLQVLWPSRPQLHVRDTDVKQATPATQPSAPARRMGAESSGQITRSHVAQCWPRGRISLRHTIHGAIALRCELAMRLTRCIPESYLAFSRRPGPFSHALAWHPAQGTHAGAWQACPSQNTVDRDGCLQS